MEKFFEGIGNFFKRIFEALASFFRTLFGGSDTQPGATPATTTQPATSQPTTSAAVEQDAGRPVESEEDIQRRVALKELTDTKMKNKVTASLSTIYQHTGEKAAKADAMGAKSDRLFKEMWAAEDADAKMFADVAFVGSKSNPKEQYMTPEASQKALPMYLAHNPTHHAALGAKSELHQHWREVNDLFNGSKMDNVGLSRLAVNPQNAVAPEDVFTQDKHGLRINMPPNSRLDIKSVDANNVSVTVRPISDNAHDTYNFAPVTMSNVSKEVFEEGYATVQSAKRGRTEVYAKAGTFAEGTTLGVVGDGSDVAGKGIYLARAVKGQDGKTEVEIQEPVAALSTYKPKPVRNKTDFRGAAMPVGVDHTDPRDDAGGLFAQAVRTGGDYYGRQPVNSYSGYGGIYGGYGRVGNITEVTRPSGIPNHGHPGRPFGRSGG